MKKYQKPVLDAVEYEVEEILTASGWNGLIDGGQQPEGGGDSIDFDDLWK